MIIIMIIMIIMIIILLLIHIGAAAAEAGREPPNAPGASQSGLRSAQVRAQEDRAQRWNMGFPQRESLCPVVLCP